MSDPLWFSVSGVYLRWPHRLQVCVPVSHDRDAGKYPQRLGDVGGNIEPRGEREIVEPSLRAPSGVGPELECGAERVDVARIVDDRAVPAVFDDLGKTVGAGRDHGPARSERFEARV